MCVQFELSINWFDGYTKEKSKMRTSKTAPKCQYSIKSKNTYFQVVKMFTTYNHQINPSTADIFCANVKWPKLSKYRISAMHAHCSTFWRAMITDGWYFANFARVLRPRLACWNIFCNHHQLTLSITQITHT